MLEKVLFALIYSVGLFGAAVLLLYRFELKDIRYIIDEVRKTLK
jgi:hypothetical protein